MKKMFIGALLFGASIISCYATNPAKYVFFFIGDGMGMNHVTATEYYLGEKEGKIETESLLFSTFPYVGLSKTYSASNTITDSAAGGTALATGSKTKNHVLGMDASCKKSLQSIAEKAHQKGIPVGIATSVSVDHATPASFYAHQPSRKMYYEISKDLAKSGFDFFAGSDFLTRNKENDYKLDTIRHLVSEQGYTIVRGIEAYKNRDKSCEKLILLQDSGKSLSSLPFAIDRKKEDLTLPQITSSAIDFLKDKNKGFFVMIEGGMIDWSNHSNDLSTTLEEVVDFDMAIREAYNFYLSKPDSTLIVITADHETGGLGIGERGYTMNLRYLANQHLSRYQLSGLFMKARKETKNRVKWENVKEILKEQLGFWNTIEITPKEEQLLKTAYERSFKKSASKVKSEYFEDERIATVAIKLLNDKANAGWTTNSHTAACVPVFAIGVGAENFVGVMENTDIPVKIAKIAGY